jgi:hypothetical protein
LSGEVENEHSVKLSIPSTQTHTFTSSVSYMLRLSYSFAPMANSETRNNKKILYVIYLIHTFQTFLLCSCLTILRDYQWILLHSITSLFMLFVSLALSLFSSHSIFKWRTFIVPSQSSIFPWPKWSHFPSETGKM